MNADQSLAGGADEETSVADYERYVRKLSNDRLIRRLDESSDLLKLGACIRIAIGEEERDVASTEELPDELFEIIGIDFSHSEALTNETMAALRELQEVRELNLSGAAITGVGALRAMIRLRSLCLDRTHIKGLGLQQLKHLKTLRRLSLAGVELSESEAREIHEALPECIIQR